MAWFYSRNTQLTWLTSAVVIIALFMNCCCAQLDGSIIDSEIRCKCENCDMVISEGAAGGRAVRETDFMSTR